MGEKYSLYKNSRGTVPSRVPPIFLHPLSGYFIYICTMIRSYNWGTTNSQTIKACSTGILFIYFPFCLRFLIWYQIDPAQPLTPARPKKTQQLNQMEQEQQTPSPTFVSYQIRGSQRANRVLFTPHAKKWAQVAFQSDQLPDLSDSGEDLGDAMEQLDLEPHSSSDSHSSESQSPHTGRHDQATKKKRKVADDVWHFFQLPEGTGGQRICKICQ